MTLEEMQKIARMVTEALEPIIRDRVDREAQKVPYTIREELNGDIIDRAIRDRITEQVRAAVVVRVELAPTQ